MSARNFDTISPSAGALLMMKAMTDIPFAKETAAMVADHEAYIRNMGRRPSKVFLGRMIHFENRYKTIDAALAALTPRNILELSSGFSCRSLDMAREAGVTYVDTDLPAFIRNKKILVEKLIADKELHLEGQLYIEPLNVMDEAQFAAAVSLLPEGPVTFVNEGLLVYLDETEKRALCNTIHRTLAARGGYWITGDIYIKRVLDTLHHLPQEAYDEELTKFLEEHRIEDNKFDNYEAAEAFFNSCSFKVVRKIDVAFEALSSLQYISYTVQLEQLKEWMKGRETWVLQPL